MELTPAQELQKIRLLNNLKKEIENNKMLLKENNKIIRKNKFKTNLKISLKTLKLIYPYAIIICIITEIFKISHMTPIVKNDKKRYATTVTELDNTGIIKKDKQYLNINDKYGELYYYFPWEKENNTYTQKIYKYNINREKIIELLNKEDLTIDDIVKKPSEIITNTKSVLEEKDNKATIKAIIFDENKEEYILEKETNVENLLDTFLYFIALLTNETGLFVFRTLVFDYDYTEEIIKVKESNKVLDEKDKDIKKRLLINNSNYQRLMKKYE